jgi:hypothetical protein
MGLRSTTTPSMASNVLPPTVESDEAPSSPALNGTATSTVSVGTGGTLLKSSVGTIDTTEHQFRVLVVEDNSILRNLL